MLLGDLAAAAPSAGIELSVGYLSDTDGSPAAVGLREHGIEPELVSVKRMLEPGALPRVRRHLVRARPDIVHTQLDLADALGGVAARSLGLPCVSTIHLIVGQRRRPLSSGSIREATRNRLVALVRRYADARVIAVSNAARDAYLATGWDTPQRVVTVHNGIARAALPEQGRRARVELGLDPSALVVSTVTVLRPGKGHDIAIEAVRRLLPRFPHLHLVIMGDGPARSEIQRLAEVLGDQVIFTGHRDDVMAILMATDVLLHPTLNDAFPTALLEAAAACVPVVASAVGGIPEIIKDGETGFLVPAPPTPDRVAARLEPLLVDAVLRVCMGSTAGERFQQHFTAERWAARLREVVYEVHGSDSRQP